jgi:hypothetical protein
LHSWGLNRPLRGEDEGEVDKDSNSMVVVVVVVCVRPGSRARDYLFPATAKAESGSAAAGVRELN